MSENNYKNYLDNVVTECFNNHLSSLDWNENDPIQKGMYLRLHDASKQLIRKMKAKAINTSHCKIDAYADENWCHNYKSRVNCNGCEFNLNDNYSEKPNSSF